MLFAVSGVTAFSSIGRRTGLQKSRAEFPGPLSEFAEPNKSQLCRKGSSTRLHALGNSDDAASWDPLSAGPGAAMRHRTPRTSTRRFATRLNYCDGDEHEPQVIRQETASAIGDLQDKEAAKWWRSVFHKPAPTSPEDEEQQVVDEYLEFLDKRYKRLHEKERKKPEPAPKKFSALGWLTADKSDLISQQEEDALYVLGVAELASERLLQKHHTALQQHKRKEPIQEIEKEQKVVIDAVVETETVDDDTVVAKVESSEARKALMFATLAEAGRKVLKSVSVRRKALIAFQEKQVVAALLLAFKTALDAPIKATKLFWNLGGGKRTIALTASAFITAFLVVRPVAQAVLSEAMTFSG